MFTMRVEGGAQLAATLRTLSQRLSNEVLAEGLLDEIGNPLARDVSRKARRAPGLPDLAANIHATRLRSRGREARVGVGSPKQFFYDWFLEYGTVRMPAFPFYRPAIDSHFPPGLGRFGRRVWADLVGRGVYTTRATPTTGGRFL